MVALSERTHRAILSGTNVNGSFSITNGSARNMLLENGGLLTGSKAIRL
ncbi:AIDA repeat-containing protein [Escherichia coli]